MITYNPNNDELDELTHGYVLANRVNDVLAAPSTKRYKAYLDFVQRQFEGRDAIDDAARFRDNELVPRALDAYEYRHGTKTKRHVFFQHREKDFRIGAVPHAVDGLIGLTVHVRETMETYEVAVEKGLTPPLIRSAQAQMIVCDKPYWIHLNYFEDSERRIRRLHEHEILFDEGRAKQIEESMIGFLMKTRLRACAE